MTFLENVTYTIKAEAELWEYNQKYGVFQLTGIGSLVQNLSKHLQRSLGGLLRFLLDRGV